LEYVLAAVGGWLAGSIPSGYWVVRLARGIDIRRVGSRSIGATNVWRVLGWRYGVPVIVLDVAKGLVPALAARLLVDDLAGVLAGGAAMAGHWRPLFLRFERGGKIVATTAGVLLGLAPEVALSALVIWAVAFLVVRYVSVASMVAAVAVPILAFAFGESWPVQVLTIVGAAAVVVLHRGNLDRLRRGKEPRVRLKAVFGR
jgi:acyl phosphate:glycerol-3-phosphate acyltransferase